MTNQRGQILIELIVSLLLVVTFLVVSITYTQDFTKTSYRYMLTQPLENQ